MDPKPLKRSPHIVKLSRDHHNTLLFSWKIRQGLKMGVGPERIQKYVRHFWEHDAQPHFRLEEEILFAPVSDDKVQQAVSDHIRIKAQVENVLDPAAAGTPEALSLLADMIDAHVRYEERVLFPHLEKTIPQPQLENIGLQLNSQPSQPEAYSDAFWLKA